MATLRKRGGLWFADYRVGGRRVRKALKTTQRSVAEEAIKAIEGDLVRGTLGIPIKGAGVERVLTEYLADRRPKVTANWANTIEHRIKTLLDTTGIKRLDDLTPVRIEKYLRERRAAYGAVRARDDFEMARAFARWAVRMGYLTVNPFLRVEPPPRPPRQPIHYLTREEGERLFAACEGPVPMHGPGAKGDGTRERRTPLGVMARVAFYAGLRAGEVVALRWEDVDLTRDLLHVRVREGWAPKDKESRSIPVHPRLKEALLGYREGREDRKGSLFKTSTGTPYGVTFIHHELVKVARRAGLKANWYTLRHSFGSLLAQSGVDLYAIAKLLGHASVTTTERHYAALKPEDLGAQVAKL